MNLLERYIAKIVFFAFILVFFAILSLYSFITFVQQSSLIGEGNFELYDALYFVFFTMPWRAYNVFPFAILLGTLLGVSYLNSQSELTALRCTGLSHQKILVAIIKLGIILTLFIMLIGEFVSPITQAKAQHHKNIALYNNITLDIKKEVWIKDKDYYANIRSVHLNKTLSGINIYKFNEKGQLKMASYAKHAFFNGQDWILQDIKQTYFDQNELITNKMDKARWDTPFNLNLVDIIATEIVSLSAYELYQYANYLDRNQLDSSSYYLVFWQKLSTPLTLLAMILLAYPFAISHIRSNNMGTRLVIGIVIGLSFNILNKIGAEVGQIYQWPPFISATFLTFICLLIGLSLIRKTF